MFPGNGLADPERWMREQEERSARLQEQANEARTALTQIMARETSRDGAAVVTVNPGGQLVDLEFTRRADDLTPTALRTAVMDAYRRAQAAVAARTEEVMSGLLGAQSESMAFLRSTLPAPPVDEDTPPPPPRRDDHGDEGFQGFGERSW
ncbi:DNA-binding protein YbaB [Crossiella equi]|uniref:DNA-binding protein YbaB n=1 Tax=Crossiella equi TaxID=130796 RepID=A0ABS5AA90_9PSEU|nr:YbaB/EbfC family nucleoid-associated protein [Crossiella equi]MBP2473124.1 DNA-binding protein YbaB [Crossiella equi]